MKRPGLILTLLLLIPIQSIAANWVEVVNGINESTSYIDTDSIQRDGHKVTVWSRHMFYQSQSFPGLGTFNEMRIKQTIDCQAGTSAHLLVTLYDRGKEVRSETANPPRAKRIIPGGIADMTRRTVCKDSSPGQH